MTATVQYWRLPEEEADMIAYLTSLGPTVALPVRRVASVEALVWRPLEDALRDDDNSFLITPSDLASQMKVHHNAQGYAADVTSTPALLYTRGRLVANQLVFTSFAGSWDHLDDDHAVTDKPIEFIRWGKKVMQWVRRTAPNWYRFKQHRITPKAEAARDAGMEMIL
ncbi:MAG: hypothetical protein WKG01_10045 [Kofleriaceae bacterium]